jgi:hypothetical protein
MIIYDDLKAALDFIEMFQFDSGTCSFFVG